MAKKYDLNEIANQVVNLITEKEMSYMDAIRVLEKAQEKIKYDVQLKPTKKEGD